MVYEGIESHEERVVVTNSYVILLYPVFVGVFYLLVLLLLGSAAFQKFLLSSFILIEDLAQLSNVTFQNYDLL